MINGYEDKAIFAECEFRVFFSSEQGKVPETSDTGNVMDRRHMPDYHLNP